MLDFCTIVTASHLPDAVAVGESLHCHGTARLHVLVVDAASVTEMKPLPVDNIRFLTLDQLTDTANLTVMRDRYRRSGDLDQLRWALKPILQQHLIGQGAQATVCTDCDICFFASYAELLTELERAPIVLTPHWHQTSIGIRNRDLQDGLWWGYFNAGLVGVSSRGNDFLEWWARACAYRLDKIGGMHDQRYLDVVPFLFPATKILDHQGYNLAQWNLSTCRRDQGPAGEVLINNKWPVVCVHFYRETIECIRLGRDPLLRPHLHLYEERLAEAREMVKTGLKVTLSPPVAASVRSPTLSFGQKLLRATGHNLVHLGRRLHQRGTPSGYTT